MGAEDGEFPPVQCCGDDPLVHIFSPEQGGVPDINDYGNIPLVMKDSGFPFTSCMASQDRVFLDTDCAIAPVQPATKDSGFFLGPEMQDAGSDPAGATELDREREPRKRPGRFKLNPSLVVQLLGAREDRRALSNSTTTSGIPSRHCGTNLTVKSYRHGRNSGSGPTNWGRAIARGGLNFSSLNTLHAKPPHHLPPVSFMRQGVSIELPMGIGMLRHMTEVRLMMN